ncbi:MULTISPECIES: FMN-dependent NADH-azoreductase [unclassified Leisingera]|uniref:FMN-dependent NADH-azoreductase n=1 Tax=unclassified Leisingera TaxID=2614906 RepID=UPI0002DC91CA|nr:MULTISPECIES: NAD(P)H-dependent oxidoreductase [unclassified Leisingera]KIC22965.1 FMN-dependent NADH-azoreductase [Leisingera sp. ANG-S3]KIC52455.1 FMN-dependent NADH-azoreductase [Leisingera sp. ANG-S]KID07472.1 FMN-dependent NADH-azoreductase [Leisingera sp. ANG1]
MPKSLLIVHSSARKNRSHTRDLARVFTETWTANGGGEITERDIGLTPPSIINEDWIAAVFTDPSELTDEQRAVLAESDALIEEIKAADVIALGVPMYNYSMPASLKAWFDLIARVGVTFSFDLSRGDTPIEPILSGKKLVVLSSRGEFGFAPGGERSHLNGLDPALAASAHYLGANATEMETIAIEYEEFKDERWEKSLAAAQIRTAELAAALPTE